jgi:hypothetical protein
MNYSHQENRGARIMGLSVSGRGEVMDRGISISSERKVLVADV